MAPTFGYAIFYVADVPATVAFYEAAFGLAPRFVHESKLYAEMETGATALAFAGEEMIDANGLTLRPNRAGETAAASEIGLVTEAPDALFDRAVAAGAEPVKPPQAKPWGQTVAYVRDLNGVLVEICSPMGG
ncbi:MAG: VOC family protein [Alphaproteobacteria bacterium]|nr:VOC family protein [Alphaproteobacteria bacterium]